MSTSRFLPILTLLVVTSIARAQSPSVVVSTYFGGAGIENLRDIATDSAGNIYVTGGTSSADFPTTPGVYDRTFATGGSSLGTGGPMDVFVAKLTPAGQLVWSTFLGGPNYDRAYAIEVDRWGYVYVAGRAGEGFPTTPGVVQETFAGDASPNGLYGKQDPFIAKLSPDGSQLVWSTYFGAGDGGIIRDIDIDSIGNVYLVSPGSTLPHPHITPGAFQTTQPGGGDMVVAKITDDGRRVAWATYLGGSADDGGGPSIRVGPAGHAYVVGQTRSTDLPVTAGAFDRTFNGGSTDLMIARFTPDGTGLIYLTYFGGGGNEALETHNIALDAAGNAYVCGYTSSTDLPVTSGAFDATLGGGNDIPIAKISADGSSLLACTYLGGSLGEGSQGIALDAAGNVVVGGGSASTDFPTTPGAFQRVSGGGSDVVVAKLSGDLTRLVYSTYVGGSDADDGRTAWMDADGTFYVAGHSRSTNFPLVAALQIANAGGDDGIIVKLAAVPVTPSDTAYVRMRLDCDAVRERGSARLVVERSGRLSGATVVAYRVAGDATVGSDLQPLSGSVRFDDGDSIATIDLVTIDDAQTEGLESITLTLSGVVDSGAAVIIDSATTVWIIDDEVAGRNLLSDPGFEAAGAGWQKTTNGGRSIVTGTSHGGDRSQQMLLSSQFPREVFQDVPVVAGRGYFASGWIHTEGAASGGVIEVLWLDGAGGVVSSSPIGAIGGSEDWTEVTGCATAPAGADSARFRLYAPVEPDNAGTVWFDDLELLDPTQSPTRAEESIGAEVLVSVETSSERARSLELRVVTARPASLLVEIVDLRGATVDTRTISADGSTPIVIDGLAAGAYLYRVRAVAGDRSVLRQGSVRVR